MTLPRSFHDLCVVVFVFVFVLYCFVLFSWGGGGKIRPKPRCKTSMEPFLSFQLAMLV